jgi:hypothetical protein
MSMRFVERIQFEAKKKSVRQRQGKDRPGERGRRTGWRQRAIRLDLRMKILSRVR